MTSTRVPVLVAAVLMTATALLAQSMTDRPAQDGEQENSTKRIVTFQTEDGLTLYGTLHLPKVPPRVPVAGAVLFAEPVWTVRSTLDGRLGQELADNHGMAILTVDFRGSGQNVGSKRYDQFSPRERDQTLLDVRGALKFLASQPGVDPNRLGLVAAGIAADYALREAAENVAVQAVVLLSGRLSDASRTFVKERDDVPILCLAGQDDKEAVKEMANAFYLSKHRDSRIILTTSGHGTAVFTRNKGLEEDVGAWLASNVKGPGVESAISFNTADGWALRGRLRLPDGVGSGAGVPGVVFVHGANHDHDTWHDLSRAVTKQGFATLVFDWRGKNRAIDDTMGHDGIDMPPGSRDKIHLDVQAAINFLASQEGVDAKRIGVVGATAPTTETFKAVTGDDRIRAIVMLSQYQLNDAARKYLTTSDTPIFFVASTEDLNYQVGSLAEFTKEAYRLSKSRGTELLLYDDAGRGSEMLKNKPELNRMIVRWFVEKLAIPSGVVPPSK